MKFTTTILRALEKAAALHDGQYRKNSKVPYIVHPVAVMLLTSKYSEDEAVLAVALLHDTIEDTAYTPKELERDFGERVKNFVLDITEDKSLPWRERKERYLEHLRKEAPMESVLISCSDKLHNMRDILEQFGSGEEKGNEKLWKAFEGDVEGYLWYWGEMHRIIKDRLSPAVAAEFEKVYSAVQKSLRRI